MNFAMNRAMGFVNGSSFQDITIASATLNISNVTNYYFISNPSVDLTGYSNLYLTLTDTGGKTKKVLLGAAGTGETYLEKFVAPITLQDASWTDNGDGTYTGLNVDSKSVYKNGTVANKLYKSQFSIDSVTAGTVVPIADGVVGTARSSTGTYTQYTTALLDNFFFFQGGSLFTGVISGLSFSEVLTPSATGIWFTPVSEDAEWSPNSATYTALFTRN